MEVSQSAGARRSSRRTRATFEEEHGAGGAESEHEARGAESNGDIAEFARTARRRLDDDLFPGSDPFNPDLFLGDYVVLSLPPLFASNPDNAEAPQTPHCAAAADPLVGEAVGAAGSTALRGLLPEEEREVEREPEDNETGGSAQHVSEQELQPVAPAVFLCSEHSFARYMVRLEAVNSLFRSYTITRLPELKAAMASAERDLEIVVDTLMPRPHFIVELPAWQRTFEETSPYQASAQSLRHLGTHQGVLRRVSVHVKSAPSLCDACESQAAGSQFFFYSDAGLILHADLCELCNVLFVPSQ